MCIRDRAKGSAIQEFMLYDMTTKPEYEANIVAAEILLDTDEILEYIYDLSLIHIFILIRRAAHIPLHHGLDGHEILRGNKRFVRPLDPVSYTHLL